MNKKDIARIMQVANSEGLWASGEKAALAADLLHADLASVLPVEYAAALVRWQALMFNGEWNAEALNDVLWWMKRAIIVDTAANLPPGEMRARADEVERKAREQMAEYARERGRFGALEV